MLVTINTDASFNNGFAGFAFWIVCDQGRIQKAGKIKNIISGCTVAEMMCIANALHTLKHSKFKGIEKIVINTDSMQCIESLSALNPKKCAATKEAILLMYELCIANNKSIRSVNKFIEFRHVKAHSGKQDARSFVNRWCDKQAKKYCKLRMREQFNRPQGHQPKPALVTGYK